MLNNRLKPWIQFVCLMLAVAVGIPAKAELTVTEEIVTDVTPTSFSVLWIADEAATSGVNVFYDVLGAEPVVNVVVDLQYTESNDLALAMQAEDHAVLRVRVSGLRANTAYFYQTTTTFKQGGTVTLFPAVGPLPSVLTLDKSFSQSNESLGAQILQSDGFSSATGSVLLIEVPGSVSPISHMVGDGFSVDIAAINLANFYDADTASNLMLHGSEAVTLSVVGGLLGQTEQSNIIPTNDGQGELTVLSTLVLDDRLDSDSDGMPDAFEIKMGLNPAVIDANEDPDGDNLDNIEEYRNGTDPFDFDTDGDNLSDGDEINTHGTLPTQFDTDRDGLADDEELNAANSTDPVDADSDDDGVSDGVEIAEGTDPNDSNDTPVLDSDGDGEPDPFDNCPLLPNPDQTNTDGDEDGDICDSDDDNDGILDGVDNSPLEANPLQEDGDSDGVGDVSDNCPIDRNESQADFDLDGLGDPCDPDDDNDGVNDFTDPSAPSDVPYLYDTLISFVSTNLPVSNQLDAFVGIAKTDFSTNTSVTLGYFNMTTRVFMPSDLSPSEEALVGVLVITVDTNGCNCVVMEAGTSVTLETEQGVLTLRLPEIDESTPQVAYLISVDGSSYRSIFSQSQSLTNLLQPGLVSESLDNCQFIVNPLQEDSDMDGVGDFCDITEDDLDGDGVSNDNDNCPNSHNPNQNNFDLDDMGDVCDLDNDNDGIDDIDEITQTGTNPFNADSDGDGIDDGEEDFDFDGRSNVTEINFQTSPLAPNTELLVGMNQFNYPVLVPTNTTAFSLLSTLGGDGIVSQIKRYNTATESYEIAEYDFGTAIGNDFLIANGEGYLVVMAEDSDQAFNGSITCTTFNVVAGINLIGFSCVAPDTSAFDLLEMLGGPGIAESVQRLDKESGKIQTATYNGITPVGIDFAISNSESYMVHMNTLSNAIGFTISQPIVTVTSHTNGEVVTSSNVTLMGTLSDLTTQVTINGVAALVTLENGVPTFTLTDIGLTSGINTFAIVARGASNLVTSQVLTLELALPPELSIDLPRDGQVTFGSPYNVRGMVSDPFATVMINGVLATLEGNEYSAEVALLVGVNSITVTATGSNAAVTTESVSVDYQPVQLNIQAGSSSASSVEFYVGTELMNKVGGRQWSTSAPSGVTYDDTLQTNLSDRVRLNYSVSIGETVPAGEYSASIAYRFVDKNDSNEFVFTENLDFVITVTAVAGPPILSINSHSDGQTVFSTPVLLSGSVTDNAATVTINGVNAAVAANSFSYELALVAGANVVNVEATNSFGTSSTSMTLIYDNATLPIDLNVNPGGSDSATRNIVTTAENFSQIALFSNSVSGLPSFLSFSTVSAQLFSPDTVQMTYSISAASGAIPGIYTISVTYNFLDSNNGVLFSEVFDVVIEVLP